MKNQLSFTRIGSVYVPTTNIEAAIEWYTKNLQFKCVNKFEELGTTLGILHHPHVHSIAMVLIQTLDHLPLQISMNGKPFPIMSIHTPDIDHTHHLLRKKGVEVGKIHILGNNDAKYFHFKDKEGNLLEAAWSIWDPVDEIKEGF